MTANLSIPLASAEHVLAIPLAAVFTEMNERYVYVQKEEGYEARSIHIGVTDFQFAEVLDGLAAGETVSLVRPPDAAEFKAPSAEKKEGKSAALIIKQEAGITNRSAAAEKRTGL